jgi:hypothetical protein
MMRLDDKITLITGVSQYMGPAFTRTFPDLHDPLRSPDKPTPYFGDGLVNIHPSAQAIVDRSAEPVVEGELRGGVTGRWRSAR